MKTYNLILPIIFGNKTQIIVFFIFLLNHLIYAQQEVSEVKLVNDNETLINMRINEPVLLKDSLSILLTSFSHKRLPYHGIKSPTKTTVDLSLSKGNSCGKVNICRYGLEGKSGSTDVTSSWNEYTFKLKGFDDSMLFKIIVSKNQCTD